MIFRIKKNAGPAPKISAGRPRKYPLEQMEVGSSVRVDANYYAIYSCIRGLKSHPDRRNWQFTIEKLWKKDGDVLVNHKCIVYRIEDAE